MNIEFPNHIYFLATLPLLLAGIFWYFNWWQKAKSKLGHQRHFAYLGKSLRFWRAPGNIMALTVVALLLSIALLNPRTPDRAAGSAATQGLDVAIALDVSNSMLATDLPPSRMQQATLLLQMLLDTLGNNRVSFTAFAGEAYLQMPLTTDIQAARTIIETVSTKMVPLQGTSLARALTVAGGSLDPTPSNHKALILISDGETHDEESLQAAEALRQTGVMIITVGIGSAAGIAIKDENGFALRDPETNEPVISALNEELLQQLAAATEGEYHRFTNAGTTLSSILSDLNGMDKKPISNLARMNYDSYAFWILGVALVLLLMQPLRRIFLAKTKIPIAAALMLLSLQSIAQDADLKKARQLYQQGQLDAAGQALQSILKSNPDNEIANFYLGNLAFKNGDYTAATEYYDKSRQYLQQNQLKANAANNQGVALANSNNLPQAIDVLKEALRRNPYDADIQHNLNVAIQKQKQDQPPPKQPPPPPQQKQNEDKLKALEQEEKKIREKQQEKKQSGAAIRNW